MQHVVKGVTLCTPLHTASDTARRNMDTIITFFSLYLRNKEEFYALWTRDHARVVTPFVVTDVITCTAAVHEGWEAVCRFWDPIFDHMRGTFQWFVDEMIAGEDPNVIIVTSHSHVNVFASEVWGNKQVSYNGRYVQIFKFMDGKIRYFEEYYDTRVLGDAYGA